MTDAIWETPSNWDAAAQEKSKLENAQRQLPVHKRKHEGVKWKSKLFHKVKHYSFTVHVSELDIGYIMEYFGLYVKLDTGSPSTDQ